MDKTWCRKCHAKRAPGPAPSARDARAAGATGAWDKSATKLRNEVTALRKQNKELQQKGAEFQTGVLKELAEVRAATGLAPPPATPGQEGAKKPARKSQCWDCGQEEHVRKDCPANVATETPEQQLRKTLLGQKQDLHKMATANGAPSADWYPAAAADIDAQIARIPAPEPITYLSAERMVSAAKAKCDKLISAVAAAKDAEEQAIEAHTAVQTKLQEAKAELLKAERAKEAIVVREAKPSYENSQNRTHAQLREGLQGLEALSADLMTTDDSKIIAAYSDYVAIEQAASRQPFPQMGWCMQHVAKQVEAKLLTMRKPLHAVLRPQPDAEDDLQPPPTRRRREEGAEKTTEGQAAAAPITIAAGRFHATVPALLLTDVEPAIFAVQATPQGLANLFGPGAEAQAEL